MLALVKTALGHGNLEVIDREEPTVGKDQVKILVKYAGICGSDLHTYEGKYKVTNPDKVLDGDLNGFIKTSLLLCFSVFISFHISTLKRNLSISDLSTILEP